MKEMKKVIVVLVALLTTFAASAQEKKGGFALELGLGQSQFGNYSALSAFADPTEGYDFLPAEHITAGYYNGNGWFYGLTLGVRSGNTVFQNLNENFADFSFLLDIRDYFKLTNKMELEVGVAGGLLMHKNSFDYMDQHYSPTRLGYEGHLTLGLNYLFKEGHYLGIRAMIPQFGTLMDAPAGLPEGLTPNSRIMLSGCTFQLNYGIRF
jgi:hypothetical protein